MPRVCVCVCVYVRMNLGELIDETLELLEVNGGEVATHIHTHTLVHTHIHTLGKY